ncbi:MAG: hypothetical protein RLZ98_1168 [Pseudomonadota bacterium]|jgi:molybdopterin-guanine dinucleotide biosynthesis protein B
MNSLLPVFGIVGYKNSGKTTLTVRLVQELTRRGLRVATVKHAHHSFQIDDAETDSARHRRAGAAQVAIVSSRRWAIVTELRDTPEPTLSQTLSALARHDPPHDLVLVEGYKDEPIPKLECRRRDSKSERTLADADPDILAIASDHELSGAHVPVFPLDDAPRISDFILTTLKLG